MANLEKVTFDSPKLIDREVIEKLDEILGITKAEVKQRQYHSVAGGDPFTEPADQNLVKLLDHGEVLIRQFVHHHNTNIILSVQRQPDNPFADRIEARAENQQVDLMRFLEFVRACKQTFGEIGRNETIGKFLGEDVQKHYQAREAALVRMEQANAEATTRLDKYVLDLTEKFQKKEDELEQRYIQKEQELDQRIAAQQEEVDRQQNELEERVQKVNDRESKFERRRTITDLLQQLDNSNEDFKFELTAGTRKMRTPVALAAGLLLLILGGSAAYLTYHEMTTASPDTWSWIRPTVLSVGFVVAFGVFARWLNSWGHQHATEEFRLKRMLLDVRRANLLIETALEWKQDTQEEIPQEILDALSRNLFREGEAEEVHPVETVATALFGSAAEAKLKVGDNEVTLDRKSMKTLKKSAE